MRVDEKEIMDILDRLNDKLLDVEDIVMFEFRTNGDSQIIEFLNQQIWFSDEDERDFDEEKNDWEPLYEYLKREAEILIGRIGEIEL